MTDSLHGPVGLDVDPDDADLAELRALAPVDLERLVPGWQVEDVRVTLAARARRTVVRRVATVVAASAVVAALGAGLGLALPESTLQPALACGAHTRTLAATGGTHAPASARWVDRTLVVQLSDRRTSATAQLVDASGRAVGEPVDTVRGQAVLDVDDLCDPTGRAASLRAGDGLRVRVVLSDGARDAQCWLLPTTSGARTDAC